LFGHERHRQARPGGAEIGRGQEGHSHRIQGPSAGGKTASRENALGWAADARVPARPPTLRRAGPCHGAKSWGRPYWQRLQGSCRTRPFLLQLFQTISGSGTIKSENCNGATIERDNRRWLMLLQTLRTRDCDELAVAFPGWDLRFRQLGRGPFWGRLRLLQLQGVQVFRLSVNRLMHVEGCPPPRQLWLLSRPGPERESRLGWPAPEGGPGPGVRPEPDSGLRDCPRPVSAGGPGGRSRPLPESTTCE
jgi:hypothetical protein